MESTATTETCATLLRQYRLAAGLTQEELAERSAVSQRTVSDLERGLTSRPYRETIRRLSEALGLDRADRAHLEATARGIHIAKSPSFPLDANRNPTNVPNEFTSFVGRHTELRMLRELLTEEKVRLLTLVGTGGAGKTRLAHRVAQDVLPLFPDGVYFVPLAPLDDPQLVLPTIAAIVGLKEKGEKNVLEAVTDYFQDKEMLLILDNVERLMAAGPTVKRLLEQSAGLQVVMTSRAALHLYGEHQFPVLPLPVPNLDPVPSIEELSCYDVVALFVARARAVQPTFALTVENANLVASICSRLDGLPLAIELAAGRIKHFAVEALLQHIESRLTILTGGARDLPIRQQTLRHSIDWSYSLLSDGDQALFARLSVFAGGWSLEAAEAVCNQQGELNVLEGMAHLVDTCLVQQEREGPGFSMLETMREYAREKLDERGEADGVSLSHARYYVDLMAGAHRSLSGPPQASWFRRLDAEQGNFRAALGWTRDHGHAELGLRIASALSGYWWRRARSSEGRRWLESLLGAQQVAARVRAKALLSLGQYAYTQGDFAPAQEYLEESLRLSTEASDAAERSNVILDLGVVRCHQGDAERGITLLEQAVVTAREARHPAAVDRAVVVLSYGLVTGGHIEKGLLLAEEAVARARADGIMTAVVSLLDTIGRAKFELRDIEGARDAWRQGLRLAREIGDIYPVPYYLQGLAGVAAHQGDASRAALLLAAEDKQRVVTGAPRAREESGPWDRDLALARERTRKATWQRAWDEGRAMTLEQAIDHALDEPG